MLFNGRGVMVSAFFVIYSMVAFAGEKVNKSFFGDVAIGGYDTVHYHQAYRDGMPNASKKQLPGLEGTGDFLYEWKGAEWRFVNKKSRDKFAAAPEKYTPKYNGFCANALSLEKGLVKTDGDVWAFFGEALYLFYNAEGRQRWVDGNWKAYADIAESEWAKLKDD